MEINQDELNTMLATEIRKCGLNNAIKLDIVKEKVMKKIKEMQGNITEMENPVVAKGPNTFPNPEEDEEKFNTALVPSKEETPEIGMEAGSQPLNIPIEPKTAIIPQIPDFLKDVEPGKIFVYDFNELSVGGENLSNKPFKTMEDPEICKSMQQMWSEKGITKSEVYQTKFEKIGDIIFDYKSGMSQFIERSAEPDINIQQQYNLNPYTAQPDKAIENFVKQNVDIDKRVDDIITNIVKNYFLTNSERAINDPTNINKPTPPIPMSMPPQSPIQEQIITMKDLTTNYQKIETPVELIETISGKAKTAKLVYEGKEVKKWLLGNKEYCFPTDPMSIRMCYTK